MGALSILLAVAFTVLAIATTIAHREYEAAYARRYRDIPPVLAPSPNADADPDVEWFRRRDFALGVAALVAAIALVLSLQGST